MGTVAVGTLVLCLILKPSVNTDETKTSIVEKTPGIVKEVFKKKVIKDLKSDRLALNEDKDMLVVETLDGEAQITIGADACKRVIEPSEYEKLKQKKDGVALSTEKSVEVKEQKKEESLQENKESINNILNQLDK